MACLAGGLVPLEARLLGLETQAGAFGLLGFLAGLADIVLGNLVVLHQGDLARADPGTGAALDAVEQVELLRLVILLGPAVPVELLGQQGGGAGVGAGAAADAGLLRLGRGQLGPGRGEQAVGGLDHGHHGVGQGEAHHGPPHDHPLARFRLQIEAPQQPAYRGAKAHPGIARLLEGVSGEGNDALDERLAIDDGALDGEHGGDVEHHDADIDGPAPLGYLTAGQQLYGLFGAARGIFSGDLPHQDVLFADLLAQGLGRGGLVVLDADQAELGFEQVLEHPDTLQDLVRVLLHQAVIRGDVGLALQAVDDEDLGELAMAIELAVGGEDGAAKSGYAGPLNALEQADPVQVPVIGLGLALAPGVLSVGDQGDAEIGEAGGVGDRVLADGADDP